MRQEQEEARRLARMTARQRARERAKKDMTLFRERVAAPLKYHRNDDGTENRFILYNSEGLKFFRSSPTQFKRNLSHRYMSVELEIADLTTSGDARGGHPLNNKVYQQAIAGEWGAKVVEDISMPTPRGHEINTAPSSGDLFCAQVEHICEELNKRNATCINLTDGTKWIRPCGLHVHVDVRNYSYPDLRRFLLLYERLEPELYLMLPGYRRKSHFAVPIGAVYGNALRNPKAFLIKGKEQVKGSDLARHAIIQTAYGAHEANRHDKRSCPQSTRYAAVNLHAFFYRGTLEFRMMYGTTKAEEIIPWSMLMAFIVDAGYKMSEADLKELLTTEPEEALLRIASRSNMIADFCISQKKRFSVPQQIRECPRLGEITPLALHLYTDADVLLPLEKKKVNQNAEAARWGNDEIILNAVNRAQAARRWFVANDDIEDRD
jgi:hypothetical protein